MFDHDDEDDDDGTLRLHVSNIPFTWSKEKLAEVFGVCRIKKKNKQMMLIFVFRIEIWNNI